MRELIEAFVTIQNECYKHFMCTQCPMYDEECLVEKLPTEWDVNRIKSEVAENDCSK